MCTHLLTLNRNGWTTRRTFNGIFRMHHLYFTCFSWHDYCVWLFAVYDVLSLCRCRCSFYSQCCICLFQLLSYDFISVCASLLLYCISFCQKKCHLIWTIPFERRRITMVVHKCTCWFLEYKFFFAKNQNERKPETSSASIRLINKVIPSFFFWRTHEMNGYDLVSYRWWKKQTNKHTDSKQKRMHVVVVFGMVCGDFFLFG